MKPQSLCSGSVAVRASVAFRMPSPNEAKAGVFAYFRGRHSQIGAAVDISHAPLIKGRRAGSRDDPVMSTGSKPELAKKREPKAEPSDQELRRRRQDSSPRKFLTFG